jgi:hypothetical protein
MTDRQLLLRASWRSSSRCDTAGECVCVARVGETCAIRDSKNPDQKMIVISVQSLGRLVRSIAAGDHDMAAP